MRVSFSIIRDIPAFRNLHRKYSLCLFPYLKLNMYNWAQFKLMFVKSWFNIWYILHKPQTKFGLTFSKANIQNCDLTFWAAIRDFDLWMNVDINLHDYVAQRLHKLYATLRSFSICLLLNSAEGYWCLILAGVWITPHKFVKQSSPQLGRCLKNFPHHCKTYNK